MVTEIEAHDAISKILEYIEPGQSTREGLKDTPLRVVNSWKEIFAGYKEDPAEVLSSLSTQKIMMVLCC